MYCERCKGYSQTPICDNCLAVLKAAIGKLKPVHPVLKILDIRAADLQAQRNREKVYSTRWLEFDLRLSECRLVRELIEKELS